MEIFNLQFIEPYIVHVEDLKGVEPKDVNHPEGDAYVHTMQVTYRRGDGIENGKPCGIPIEFADVIIRIADFCGRHDIPLQAAIEEKMAFNKTRSYRHGNKTI